MAVRQINKLRVYESLYRINQAGPTHVVFVQGQILFRKKLLLGFPWKEKEFGTVIRFGEDHAVSIPGIEIAKGGGDRVG
jgi:hypothetical protein